MLLGLTIVAIWIVWAFAQEVLLSYQLSRQASDLRNQNAAMQATNDSYKRDIAALASGGAAEEEARLNGYSRSDEKLYIVSAPSTASNRGSSTGSPGSGSGATDTQLSGVRGAWDWLTGSARRL